MQTVAKIFVISGPSGSGKSTLLKRLFNDFPGTFGFSISHTTRGPRPKEENGVDYHFVTKELMVKEIEQGKFIESATFSGNLYGTSIKAVKDVVESGKVCILDIDMQGVKAVKNTDLNPKYIFIQPPNFDILEQRLRGRGTETEDAVLARLMASKAGMDYAQQPSVYDRIIINDDLETAYKDLQTTIFEQRQV
ncbi:guanylate kinase [Chlamydoabsidia padenii]|nr:guanylate kinase [Chlamydoabsidia padenii]